MAKNRKEIPVGSVTGRLVVLKEIEPILKPGRPDTRVRLFLCSCSCGNETIIRMGGFGRTKSCGCLVSEAASNAKTTHGLSKSRDYTTWSRMKQRCQNPKAPEFHDYGGRGITVCPEWESFEQFHKDMGERPAKMSLDRIDNTIGYSKSNCRWATSYEQARNKRNNVMVSAFGKVKTLMEWDRISGLSLGITAKRLAAGWTPEEAITRPSRNKTNALEQSQRAAHISAALLVLEKESTL